MISLSEQLNKFSPFDENEKQAVEKIKQFLQTENCFSRSNSYGHITAGALVVSRDNQVLLNHHKKTNMWFQFGGHCDGDEDCLHSAKREVEEESGIKDVELIGGGIFNADVQVIPENLRKNEKEHFHFDINYLLLAKTKDFTLSDESTEIKWCSIEEAKQLISPFDIGTKRMIEKFQKYVNSFKK